AHWLDMRYAREVKKLLLEHAHVEAIVTFPTDQPVFEHALTTAAITLIRKGADGSQPSRIIRAGSASPADLAASLDDPSFGEPIDLAKARKWSRPVKAAPTSDVTLGAFARVRRGAATGYNAFFVLSEERRRELKIDSRSVVPCLSSPRHISGNEVTQETMAE